MQSFFSVLWVVYLLSVKWKHFRTEIGCTLHSLHLKDRCWYQTAGLEHTARTASFNLPCGICTGKRIHKIHGGAPNSGGWMTTFPGNLRSKFLLIIRMKCIGFTQNQRIIQTRLNFWLKKKKKKATYHFNFWFLEYRGYVYIPRPYGMIFFFQDAGNHLPLLTVLLLFLQLSFTSKMRRSQQYNKFLTGIGCWITPFLVPSHYATSHLWLFFGSWELANVLLHLSLDTTSVYNLQQRILSNDFRKYKYSSEYHLTDATFLWYLKRTSESCLVFKFLWPLMDKSLIFREFSYKNILSNCNTIMICNICSTVE